MEVREVVSILVLVCLIQFSVECKQVAGSFINYPSYHKNDILKEIIQIFDGNLVNSSRAESVRLLDNPLSRFQAIINQSNYADVHQAATIILKLQDTYQFKAEDLRRGRFNEVKLNLELSSRDCFLIGKAAFLKGYHSLAVQWLQEALKYSFEEIFTEDLLDYLAFSMRELRDERAFKYNEKLLKLNPTSKVALMRKYHYEIELQAKKSGKLQFFRNKGYHLKSTSSEEKFKECCRGDIKLTASATAHLKCGYINNLDFLKIAPLKFEEAHKNPLIVIYHDILSDKEINTLKDLAEPKLTESKTKHPITGVFLENKHRVSKSAKFEDDANILFKTLNQRLEDMTGLTTKTAEPLHVTKYLTGGFYATHHDSLYDSSSFNGTGNRLASVLFFLNDVPVGGATCFPALNLSITPKKGSAIFWYNLLDTGLRDFKLIHGGCPIAVGNKWIALKLLHELGQLKTCSFFKNSD